MVIITGFFGMNLPLPWQHSPYGTWYALGLMTLTTVATLLYFKKRNGSEHEGELLRCKSATNHYLAARNQSALGVNLIKLKPSRGCYR